MQKLYFLLLFLLIALCWACKPAEQKATTEIPSFLPLKTFSTTTVDDFQADGTNWQVVGEVYADLHQKGHFELVDGEGVLVNNQTEEARSHLFTKLEHGDLELEVEFMMPKGSNSGIYFQSRYEIQLFDSWGKEEVKHSDCGGIYQRWDESKPDGEKGYEGHAPAINASLAPGLWQKFRILFKAPRFDETGNKIANARFDSVYHNGMLIHAGVEVMGPTRAAAFEDEVPLAPLMIQGDHGKVAFRNIQYKAYGADTLKLGNMHYELFESPGDRLPEDFDALTLVKSGQAKDFKVSELSEENAHFAVRYTADLEVSSPGEYLFTTDIDDGGELFIDGQLVVHNVGDPGRDTERGKVNLTEGTHQFVLTYYQEVWRALMLVEYEGPGIYRRYLGGQPNRSGNRKPTPITVEAGTEAEMIRGFVRHGDEKRTHTISVGDPSGLHYSYDLSEGSLLSAWRGKFADVTEMWHNRGHSQLLKPLETSIQMAAGIPIMGATPENLAYKGHKIENGRPVFMFSYGKTNIEDKLYPADDRNSLARTLRVENADRSMDIRLAEGNTIRKLENGLYYVNGKYYLSFDTQNEARISLKSVKGNQQLIASLGEEGLTYQMLW